MRTGSRSNIGRGPGACQVAPAPSILDECTFAASFAPCRLALLTTLLIAASASAAPPDQPAAEPAAAKQDDNAPDTDASSPAAESKDVNFHTEVLPILMEHCLQCHNQEFHCGNLRLETKQLAGRGGDSGRPILGGTLETNELYARISSDERTYRMPKNAPSLEPDEIEAIRRWVEQGTPWPTPDDHRVAEPTLDKWIRQTNAWIDQYKFEYDYTLPYIVGLLVAQIGLLVILRCRAAYRAGRPWATGRMAPFCKLAAGVRSRDIVAWLLLSVGVVTLMAARGHTLRLQDDLKVARTDLIQTNSAWTHTIYGWPPKPVRFDGPPQVNRTYYRGNCERNPELFNGGNYLTATFRVSLCDGQRRPLEIGQPIPTDDILLRCEIDRAPGTTDLLFSEEAMGSTLLTEHFHELTDKRAKMPPARLEVLEPMWRWVAYVPVGLPDQSRNVEGVIYMYTGRISPEGVLAGTPHYGIQYVLKVADGKLSPESDLWMSSFGNAVFAPPPAPGLLPHNEWFDEHPLPVIEGENTKDTKLLGVDEHVQKGLIKPPPTPSPTPAKNPPPENQPDDSPEGE